MCGIAGFVARNKVADPNLVLHRMVGALLHRGPDDTGLEVDGACAIGHARLSIIDIAGGKQPVHNEDGSLSIVFNGEIFNYLEIREELVARGHRFATHSDTEVILHLYEDVGPDCVSSLNGQWAFAIWDRNNQTLFLSRDRMGVRPLFYACTDHAVVFGSEIKAVMQYPGISAALDVRALDEICTFWHSLPPRTAFRNIYEIPPGHSAYVRDFQISVWPYWDIHYDPEGADLSSKPRPEQEYGEELLALLADASRLRLRADVPVGAYLSGGLDSTMIASLIRRSGISRLRTFSVRFDEEEFDEGPFQDLAAHSLGTSHESVRCSNRAIGDAFPDVVWHTEKPIIRTAPAPLFLLSGLVHQAGFKVVLTGEGADELLGGYDIYKETKIRSFWARYPSSKLRPGLLRRLYPYMAQLQQQPPAYLQAFFQIRSSDLGSPFFSHLPRWKVTSKLKSFFSDDVKREVSSYDPVTALEAVLPASYKRWDAFTRAQYLESRYLLPGYILSSQGDRMAMAHSVEARFPFLDHRIALFAARLPANLKMHVLKEKYLLKRIARDYVPAAVIARPKQPYRAPDSSSFFGAHKPAYIDDLLSAERIRRDGVFNFLAVEKLVAKAKCGEIQSLADNMAIVGIVSTQLLLSRFRASFN